jgi:hypothetical protein
LVSLAYATAPASPFVQAIGFQAPLQVHKPDGVWTYAVVPARALVHFGSAPGVAAVMAIE